MSTHHTDTMTLEEFLEKNPNFPIIMQAIAHYETQSQADPQSEERVFDRAVQRTVGEYIKNEVRRTEKEWKVLLRRITRRAATELPGRNKGKVEPVRGDDVEASRKIRSSFKLNHFDECIEEIREHELESGNHEVVELIDAVFQNDLFESLLEKIENNEPLQFSKSVSESLGWSVRKAQDRIGKLNEALDRYYRRRRRPEETHYAAHRTKP